MTNFQEDPIMLTLPRSALRALINKCNHSRAAFTLHALLALTLIALLATPARAQNPCPPDTDCSGAVDVDDLVAVILGWGQTGIPADVDQSGTVDVDDLVQVILAWGPCLFDFGPQYPNTEAHQIGLEMLGANGPLTLSQAQYDRIDRDLGLIRAAYPALVGQTHTMAWAPNQMIVGLIEGADTTAFDCLNTFYQVSEIDPLFTSGGIEWVVVTVGDKVNVPALGAIYTETPEVQFVDPNGLIGGQNFWVPTDMGNGTWRWNIDDGFHDCFDGCDCHRVYTIDVDAKGVVTLVNYEEFGQSWCEFKS
jgi:hypothetical protein